jgi:hypothetical protein
VAYKKRRRRRRRTIRMAKGPMNLTMPLAIFSFLLIINIIAVTISLTGMLPISIGIALAQTEEGKFFENQTSALIISTNPQYSNVEVIIDGISYRSGEKGNIVFTGSQGLHSIGVPANIVGESLGSSNASETFLSFGRWDHFMPKNFTMALEADTETRLELGLLPSNKINFEFFDANSDPINKSRIEKMILVSNKGDIVYLKYPYEAYVKNSYYDAMNQTRITERGNLTITSPRGLISNEIKFKVSQAFMDGVNVIDSKKQREFFPILHWQIHI